MRNIAFISPSFDTRTKFDRMVSLEDCRIDHFALEFLGRDYGNLSLGERAEMKIENGLAELRAAYSGFWQWVYVAALVAFLAAYAACIGMNWARAVPVCPVGAVCSTLWSALLQFIYTGGDFGGVIAWGPLLAFCFSLSYNGLRGWPLWLTKSLELRNKPVGYRRSSRCTAPRRGKAFWLSNWGFRVNLAVVLYHSWHFLQLQIPDPSL